MFGNFFSSAQRFIEEQKKRVQPVVSRIQQAVQPAISGISRAISSFTPQVPRTTQVVTRPPTPVPTPAPVYRPYTAPQAPSFNLPSVAQRFIEPIRTTATNLYARAKPILEKQYSPQAQIERIKSFGERALTIPAIGPEYSPKETISLTRLGQPEERKKLASTIESGLIATPLQGPALFGKMAFSVPRALTSSAIMGGLVTGLTKLRGEEVSPSTLLPAMALGAVGGIGTKPSGFSKQQVQMARNLSTEGRAIIGQFAQLVEQGKGKRNLGKTGEYVQSVAETIFGKSAANMSNKQLKNAFDLLIRQADEAGGVTRIPKIGLSVENVRQGQKPALFRKQMIKQPTQAIKTAEKLVPIEMPPSKPSIIKEEFAGNINLKKIDAPDEVKDLLVRTANENADLIEQQRRGVVHTKEIVAEEIARKTGMTAEKFLKTKPGQAMNAEELATLDAFMVRKMTNVQELAGKIRSGDLTGQTQLQFYKELNEAIQLEAVAAGGRAEAGRTLESLKHLRDALQNPEQIRMEQVLKALGGRDVTEDLAGKIAKLDFNNPSEIFTFLRNIYKPNLRQYIDGLFFNSVLSGPSTHLINSISNTLFAAVNNILVRPVRAGVEIPIAALQGRQREYYFREVVPAITGMLEGSQQGLRRAIEFMLRGYDATDIAGASKVERLFRVEPFRGPATIINLPSRALRAADLFFKSVNFNAQIAGSAANQAAKEGMKGTEFAERMDFLIKNPTLKMLNEAGDFADYVTFTSKPDKITSTIIGLRDKVVGSEFVIPFISTPSNLVKRGFEFSPVGFALAGGKKGAQVSDQLAKAIVGSTIAGTLAMMFWSGGITAGVPKTPAARDEFYRQGKQPYSIKIGDTWVQFQRLEPLNTPLSQIAALYDAFVNNAEMPTSDKVFAIAEALGENVISQTWLRGVADVIDAIREPQRKFGYFAESKVAGFIPTFFAQVARATDEYVRQPRGLGERLAERIPGLRETIQPKLNVMGQPVETRGIAGELFPIKFSPETTDPVEQELARLDVNIGFPTNTITTPGKKEIELTREGQYIYTQLAGQAIKQRLDRALQNPRWQGLTDEEKNTVIRKIANEERENVREAVIKIANREYEGQPMSVEAINNRLAQIGSSLKITELPERGLLNIIQSINEEEFKPLQAGP